LLLPLDSPARWAEKLLAGVRSGALLRMGPACRSDFETTFNWDTVCRKMLTTIRATGQGRARDATIA
jgi:hypothetical protein